MENLPTKTFTFVFVLLVSCTLTLLTTCLLMVFQGRAVTYQPLETSPVLPTTLEEVEGKDELSPKAKIVLEQAKSLVSRHNNLVDDYASLLAHAAYLADAYDRLVDDYSELCATHTSCLQDVITGSLEKESL